MKTLIIGAAAALLTMSAPAFAVVQSSYDLATDFGNTSVFSYGTVAGDGTFSAFSTADCSDISVSTLCYRGNDKYQVVFQKDATNVLAHPGPDSTTAVLFTAPTASLYTFNISASNGDTGTVGLSVTLNGGAPVPITQLSGTPAAQTFAPGPLSFFLNQGQSIGLVIDNAGDYHNDSTLLSGTIAAVPEPASWALMIGGFGLVGGAMRYRRGKQSVTFA